MLNCLIIVKQYRNAWLIVKGTTVLMFLQVANNPSKLLDCNSSLKSNRSSYIFVVCFLFFVFVFVWILESVSEIRGESDCFGCSRSES